MKTPGFNGPGLDRLIFISVKKFLKDNMLTYASALAYQILFSIFPFFIFLLALISTLHLPDFVFWLRQQAQMLLPQPVMEPVSAVLDQLRQPQGGLLSEGATVALWTASAGVRATMQAFNVAYGVQETRPAWKLYLLSIIYTLSVAALLILSAALLLIGPRAMQWVVGHVGFEPFLVTVWIWLRWPAALMLLSLSAALVYYSAPAAQPRFRFITPGAVLSVLLWVIASIGFDFYVRNFTDYSAMYESIGSVVALMFYFFISSAVLLFGAEINATVEHFASGEMFHPENE